ncbi:MAG: acyl carrier protein phosphodiesterase [Prevotellaceae bacterium]|jgi:acyl carrier protein phosphodiesterase|nr:acyl carrier protein phosphodiesterase [Prevotellaceae bacterium]
MNYLAHVFLSSKGAEQVGNFIGDFVKGREMDKYPAGVREGIVKHRAIDEFTDTHWEVKRAKEGMKAPFGRYAGVVLDMYFDHLLASHFSDYSAVKLRAFARQFYWQLWQYRGILPKEVKGFMWHFILTNRLCRYATTKGLGESLRIMSHYKHFPVEAEVAVRFLEEHYAALEAAFRKFFTEAIKMAY